MNTILHALKMEIIRDFAAHYTLNDGAHRVEHFEDVYQTGLIINETIQAGFDPKLILFMAYFHDLFAWSRKNHHDLSSDFILETDHKLITKYLSDDERITVAAGCQEHRASRTLPFTCQFGEMMNAADRGKPKHAFQILDRAFEYAQSRNPELSNNELIEISVIHIKEKYGVNGYARYPDYYGITFGDVLNTQRKMIDELTVDVCIRRLNAYLESISKSHPVRNKVYVNTCTDSPS